jgi:hypothetical protein
VHDLAVLTYDEIHVHGAAQIGLRLQALLVASLHGRPDRLELFVDHGLG